MSRTDKELNGVSLLGNQNTEYKSTYSPEVLETFENKHKDNDYVVTFDAYEFTSLCLAGDTLIDVVRIETEYPEGIPIANLVGTEGYVFGIDDKTLQPVCKKYSDVRCTRKNAKVVKVTAKVLKGTLMNRYYDTISTRCTPDHLVLVRIDDENKWIEAKDLKKGMKLIADGRCSRMTTIRGIERAKLVAENIYDNVNQVKHIDGNEYNNLPENLQHLPISDSEEDLPNNENEFEGSYATVEEVIDDGYADVYNMEVEDVHNFFANGTIWHNCPKTGQPDFAKVVISYIPNERMVESKSLKLYLFSFRNQGDFHEDCINMIGKDLVKLMDPKYLEVRGIFSPRGGIAISTLYTYSTKGYEDIEKQRKLDVMRDASNRAIRFDM